MSASAGEPHPAAACLCCGSRLSGRFCSQCGQRAESQRLELRKDGRMLGNRLTSRMFASYAKRPVSEACTAFGAELNAMLVGQEQEDDITFIMLEVTE